MRVRVYIRLKPEVLDVQGKAVEGAFHNLGYSDCCNVRVGKIVEFNIENSDKEEGILKAKELSEKLLANTVIEDYEVIILEE